jgi:hypothetical protein
MIGGDPHDRSMGCYCSLHRLWNVACHKNELRALPKTEALLCGWTARCSADCKSTTASAIVLRRGAVADRKKAPLSFESGAFPNLQFLHCSHSVSTMCDNVSTASS